MEPMIHQSVSDFVKQTIATAVGDTVLEAVNAKLEDPDFSDEFEMIVGSEIEKLTTITTAPEPQFKSVVEFVDRFIRPMYATTRSGQDRVNWSRKWYTHPEAVTRLNALWRTYERLRSRDEDGFLEEFLRVHADYHMRQIMSEDGVFAQCSARDTASVPLPAEPAHSPTPTQ